MEKLSYLEADVQYASKFAAKTLRSRGKILFCGNGGSAPACQHLAAELTGRFIQDRRPLAASALTTDTSALTCIGNDYSFDEVFVRQVVGIGKPEDLLIAISTSGNSSNIIRAVKEAKILGMQSVGLLGCNGGKLRGLCDRSIVVLSEITARIQEFHILLGHSLCVMIEQELGVV